MLYLHVAPMLLEVLGHQTPVAEIGQGFAAQEACPVYGGAVELLLDFPSSDKFEELFFVSGPTLLILVRWPWCALARIDFRYSSSISFSGASPRRCS